MTDRFAALRAAVEAVTREDRALGLNFNEDIPEDLRYELLRLGCSLNDYVFWVRRRPQEDDAGDEPGDQMYYAQEIESGSGSWGVTPREALDRYFKRDVLDLRGDDDV